MKSSNGKNAADSDLLFDFPTFSQTLDKLDQLIWAAIVPNGKTSSQTKVKKVCDLVKEK